MMDPTDKDTKHIKDQSTGTEGYLEYTNENGQGKPTWCGEQCGEQERPTQ